MWYYDCLGPDDPQFQGTQKAVEEKLLVKGGVGGFIRYEGDSYFKSTHQTQSNPWVITTLWDLQRRLKFASSTAELKQHIKDLQWVIDRLGKYLLLAEQYHPDTGEPLSVLPLAFSHIVYI